MNVHERYVTDTILFQPHFTCTILTMCPDKIWFHIVRKITFLLVFLHALYLMKYKNIYPDNRLDTLITWNKIAYVVTVSVGVHGVYPCAFVNVSFRKLLNGYKPLTTVLWYLSLTDMSVTNYTIHYHNLNKNHKLSKAGKQL